MSEWYLNVESSVLTTIEYMLATRKDAPFPKLKCTTANENVTPTYFPTLYLKHTYSGDGYTIEGSDLCSIDSTITIKVWNNTTERDCETILSEAEKVMREVFKYRCKTMPTATTSNKIATGQIVCNRIIGAGDTI